MPPDPQKAAGTKPPLRPKKDGALPVSHEDMARSLNWQANQYYSAGEFTLAEHFYSCAHVYAPKDSIIAGNLLSTLVAQEHYEEADKFVEENFVAFEKCPYFLYVCSKLFLKQQKYQEALPLLKRIEGIKDKDGYQAGFEHSYGLCLLKLGFAREAEVHFRNGLELEESYANYQRLRQCFEKQGTFAANESFMIERLFTDRKTDISLAARRYLLAEFYWSWFESLQDKDPKQAKYKLYRAQEHAVQSVEFAQLGSSTDDDNQDLTDANELLEEINALVDQVENGFEPPGPPTFDSLG